MGNSLNHSATPGRAAKTGRAAPARRGGELGALVLRFASGGGVCFAANLGVLWVATEKWKWHYLAALALAWAVALVLGFTLHRRWTFRARSAGWAEQARRYLAVNVGQALVSTLLMVALVSGCGLAPWLASVLCAGLLMAATFVLHRNWSFRAGEN